MALGVMKVIGIDFVVVLIFYSFNNVFVSCWVYKIFVCEWIGLLSNYHNKYKTSGSISSNILL